ncbi:MAG: CoA transferase [Candidatus Nanopelagicales bacterium]
MTSRQFISAEEWASNLLETLDETTPVIPSSVRSAPVADWARSGAVMITGTQEQPLLPTGFAATAARGALLAFDALVGDTGTNGEELLGERAAVTQWTAHAPWSLGSHCQAVRTKDGWFALSLARESDLGLLAALTSDPKAEGWRDVHRWARACSTQEAVDRCRLLGLPAGAIGSVPRRELFRVQSDGARAMRALGGMRVVDLSSLWAGPLCAHLLGLAGAQIIRAESSQRPDGGRRGIPGFDDLLHAGHLSIAFDPDDLEFLHRLVQSADVVITAARPRGLESLGLDPQRFLESKQHGVWVQLSAYGSTGPEANWVGFGDDVAMSAGLVRWVDGVPIPVADALADPITGTHAAVAAAALAMRGGAHLVEMSLADIAAATILPQPAVDPYRTDEGWFLETEFGITPVARPRARAATGTARALGADTAEVRARLAG